MHDLLPEICDIHADTVRILTPMLQNFGAKDTFYGEIVTLKTFEDNSKIREQVALDGTGKVLVVDGGGSMRHAMLGDLLAKKAADNGWSGIIIHGCIRDVNAIAEIGLGVQALGVHPLKTDKRGLGDVNVPINFGGVSFHPGEYVYADNNGVLVSKEPIDLVQLGWL
ncbi:MAG: putative 4-hydroxy-4-methyl-2-oxoglutarate aldolase [Oceanospirillaceae bacterium]|nr:putative 4-hydroxy-4-methyl-2-oxoglutarate aldolase [Oceanospirillaceae bacterium]